MTRSATRGARPEATVVGRLRTTSACHKVSGMDTVKDLTELLEAGLEATHVDIVDESHRHAGHAGARSGGGHYQALLVSEKFADSNIVARQRLVYSILGQRMGTSIHAFSMQTMTPAEWEEARGSAGRAE